MRHRIIIVLFIVESSVAASQWPTDRLLRRLQAIQLQLAVSLHQRPSCWSRRWRLDITALPAWRARQVHVVRSPRTGV